MKTLLWKLLELVDDNWGYMTPLQKRFKVGDKCKISRYRTLYTPFEIGSEVTIVETSRHDYLIEDEYGFQIVVFQFELI